MAAKLIWFFFFSSAAKKNLANLCLFEALSRLIAASKGGALVVWEEDVDGVVIGTGKAISGKSF